jgi:uncharacterized protein (TIGR03437 family)
MKILLVMMLTSVVWCDPQCPMPNTAATYPNSPLTYPMTSDRYAVQYQLNGGNWTDVRTYVSYYGGTNSSPFMSFSGYTKDTSMSYASIPAAASTAVGLRVTKLFGAPFSASNHVSVRPTAKGIHVDSVTGGTVQLSTTTSADFAGEQFVLWWDGDAQQSSAIQGLAFFLNPPYERPSGNNVKVVATLADITGDLSAFDTLDFEGTVAIGSTGDHALVVPANINTIFLAPGAWVQGKLRFTQSGSGQTRRIYGPGVLDVSRFGYMWRLCRDSTVHTEDGYQSLSWIPLPAGTAASLADRFVLDGPIIADSDYYSTDSLVNALVNNVKIIGWNANTDGLQFGSSTRAFNVFIRTGDDSLKMWGSYVTVTNATVWQNFNGGVVNLGWFDNSPGDDCLIDGLYVVKTDWKSPQTLSWSITTLNDQNNAIIGSLMVPGTKFGTLIPSLYRNIFVEDAPRVLFSLKILPSGTCAECISLPVDLSQPSVLNLNLENVFTPASTLENSIGFQTVNGAALTGTMNIGLNNIMVTPLNGTATALTSANAATLGKVTTNGSNINLAYATTSGPAPEITMVANAEGEGRVIAPNTWVEVKGLNLAPAGDSRIWGTSDFANNKMPTALDGVSVTVNGKAAYIYYISPTQINILTPPDSMQGIVQVVVNNNGVASAFFTVPAQALSPSFFVFNGGPYVAATHASGSYLGPASLYPSLTTPAKPGETIVLYANGFGPTSNPVVSGSETQSGILSPPPVIKIGGITAMGKFAGLVAPGEFQFNIVVPASLADGDHPITASYNGLNTQTGTLVTVQH